MKTFRWKVKPDMEVTSQPSVREVRFGDGYSQPVGITSTLVMTENCET